jgi:flagellar biosynthesis protein
MDTRSESQPPVKPGKPDTQRQVAVAIQGLRNGADSYSKIIASGYGKLAEQILDIAFAKGVKVRQDADLAEFLGKLDLDTPIPSEAIVAVAEILAKVYEANGKLAQNQESASDMGTTHETI